MPPTPLPELTDDLLEEIFLRLPPDEPACLVRTSLSSKAWLSLLTGADFCSRYREFHGAPPVLGFFCSFSNLVDKPDPLFISKNFLACLPDRAVLGEYWDTVMHPWDCRHGRVLLGDRDQPTERLVVLDPMTGWWWYLNPPQDQEYHFCGQGVAAVICDAASCDHSSCHGGPFRVVFIGMDDGDDGCVAYAQESLPMTTDHAYPRPFITSVWSKPCSSLHLRSDPIIHQKLPVLSQDALHFMFLYLDGPDGILKYDLRSKCLSVIDAPLTEANGYFIIMGMEDGCLGFAHLDGSILNVWSREMRSDGVGLWTERAVIDLKKFLPIQKNPEEKLVLLGSVEGRDIILVATDLGIYEFSLKSLERKKICERENYSALAPYMTFYDP